LPSKNFKNANPQTDTKTFGQVVAKLNTDKGFETRTTRTPGHNRRLAQWRVTWLIEKLLWCIDIFVLRNPPPLPSPKSLLARLTDRNIIDNDRQFYDRPNQR
jgi:hypothetical protein